MSKYCFVEKEDVLKTYKIAGFGNYSNDYGWDSGMILSTPELETEEKFNGNPLMFMGLYVDETYSNEHGGSRNSEFLVRATDEYNASRYCEIYCNRYYPKK